MRDFFAAALLLLAACAHTEAKTADAAGATLAKALSGGGGIEVQDAVHGVRYELPSGADLRWPGTYMPSDRTYPRT